MDKEFTIARTTFSQSHREFHLTFSFNIFIALWGTLRSSSFLQRIPSSQFFHRFPFILIGITCKIKKKKKIAKSSRISSFQFLSFSQSNHQSHKHPIDLSYNRYADITFIITRKAYRFLPLFRCNFLQIHDPNSKFTLIVVTNSSAKRTRIFYLYAHRTYKIIKVKIDRLLSLFN